MKTQRVIAFTLVAVLFSLGASAATAQGLGATPGISYPQLAKPAGKDLDVTYISRTPLYNRYSVWYTADLRPYLQPGTENHKRWPAPGEVVTFTAHIMNKGTVASGAFVFKWFIDGIEVAAGTHASLSPGQEGTESYQWPWGHSLSGEQLVGNHTVRFAVDPENVISETYGLNNWIEDRTDALSLYLAVTPELYQALETPVKTGLPFSAEDWLQKQIAAMNAAFARSVYPSTPTGISERVRLDRIMISSWAPTVGLELDGGFFGTVDDRQGNPYYDPVNDVSGGLIHELTHQLGIIDMYNLDVALETPQVLDQFGQPVQMQYLAGYFFPGLMSYPGIQPPVYDEHTALALNTNKGYRRGYYGEYLYDVPDQVYLRVLDNQGQPAVGATIKLYQRSSDPGLYGGLSGTIDNTPEITGLTDGNGKLLLPNRAVGTPVTTNTGHILLDNPFASINIVGNNDEFILELSKGGHQEFGWLDITALNLAEWRQASTLDIPSHIPSSSAPNAPLNLTGLQESDLVQLQWSASPSSGVTGYNIYRTDWAANRYQRIIAGTTALSYSVPFDHDFLAPTYVVTAIDSQGNESGFSNPFYSFRLANPTGLVVDEQNGRIVLDPQNGYALLYQLGNGTFFDTRGSIHYHLEYSQYISRDFQGHLILSHAGDYYSTRHSVRVADKDATPLFEFGSQGSGAGQFQTPTGVSAWERICSIEGPYNVDAHTLLLLHFDNSFGGAQAEVGSPNGVTFTEGKYAQEVTIDSSDSLTYATAGNLNRTQGAIEFWIRPHWNGSDNQSYTFFEVGNAWFNRMRIMKDGANNLRFMLWNSTTEYGVAYNVGGWQAGEWHHIAATWIGTNIALYVDGEQRHSSNTANPPDILAGTMYVGSSWQINQQANADIDELRISDIPRVGNSDTCLYRILVADSGNNRIQAFDGQGNFIAAYGGPGSGAGQFNNPQGLAVDGSGNVIVADRGNNRLQVLSFNGSSFGFVRTITADFNGPTGLATYGSNWILVADTGNNKIKVLDVQGNLLAEYTSPNDGRTGPFNRPRGVIVDRSARILVADTGNKRIVSILDALPVQVASITLAGANPTAASSVGYTVTFSEPVTGVDSGDFVITTTGIIGASITNVTGSGAAYTVTVNTGSGNGTIRLDVVDDDSIKDLANNPLGGVGPGNGNYSSGQTYTVVKVFSAIHRWTNAFDLAHGWTARDYVRTVGDINGDGEDDLVGFGVDGVYATLSNGSGFGSISKWTSSFDQAHGWTVAQFVRTVGDVNGDGKDDLVGFGLDGVYVSLSTGSNFPAPGKWTSAFDLSHGWTVAQFVRTVGDVNGDGKDDLIGFGLDGVYVAPSNGSGFGSISKWTSAFDQGHGWNNVDHVRLAGDVNGDNMADLVGFGLDGVYVALSNGSGFGAISKWTSSFDQAHGWTVAQFVRTVGDVNGDGKDDLVGFGLDGVYIAFSTGSGFSAVSKATDAFDLAHGWTVSQYVRTVGDVSGDGKDDLIGFGLDGVYIATAQ